MDHSSEFYTVVIFHPILLFNFGRFPPYTIIKFWSFSTLYYYSALYYYYILVVFHPILLLHFGCFPPYTIIPTYTIIWNVRIVGTLAHQYKSDTRSQCAELYSVLLVWPTSWTPAIGGLIVCEWVCPKTCRHIARRMMNGWLWNFACMLGTTMPTMCQILVVTQLNLKKRFFNCVCVCPKTCRRIARRMMNGWLWKLCIHVCRVPYYHDANNVSNFGGDPITFKKRFFNCVWVCPKTCRHIARRMMNGRLWNFACMSGTMMPTMCQILAVTQLN